MNNPVELVIINRQVLLDDKNQLVHPELIIPQLLYLNGAGIDLWIVGDGLATEENIEALAKYNIRYQAKMISVVKPTTDAAKVRAVLASLEKKPEIYKILYVGREALELHSLHLELHNIETHAVGSNNTDTFYLKDLADRIGLKAFCVRLQQESTKEQLQHNQFQLFAALCWLQHVNPKVFHNFTPKKAGDETAQNQGFDLLALCEYLASSAKCFKEQVTLLPEHSPARMVIERLFTYYSSRQRDLHQDDRVKMLPQLADMTFVRVAKAYRATFSDEQSVQRALLHEILSHESHYAMMLWWLRPSSRMDSAAITKAYDAKRKSNLKDNTTERYLPRVVEVFTTNYDALLQQFERVASVQQRRTKMLEFGEALTTEQYVTHTRVVLQKHAALLDLLLCNPALELELFHKVHATALALHSDEQDLVFQRAAGELAVVITDKFSRQMSDAEKLLLKEDEDADEDPLVEIVKHFVKTYRKNLNNNKLPANTAAKQQEFFTRYCQYLREHGADTFKAPGANIVELLSASTDITKQQLANSKTPKPRKFSEELHVFADPDYPSGDVNKTTASNSVLLGRAPTNAENIAADCESLAHLARIILRDDSALGRLGHEPIDTVIVFDDSPPPGPGNADKALLPFWQGSHTVYATPKSQPYQFVGHEKQDVTAQPKVTQHRVTVRSDAHGERSISVIVVDVRSELPCDVQLHNDLLRLLLARLTAPQKTLLLDRDGKSAAAVYVLALQLIAKKDLGDILLDSRPVRDDEFLNCAMAQLHSELEILRSYRPGALSNLQQQLYLALGIYTNLFLVQRKELSPQEEIGKLVATLAGEIYAHPRWEPSFKIQGLLCLARSFAAAPLQYLCDRMIDLITTKDVTDAQRALPILMLHRLLSTITQLKAEPDVRHSDITRLAKHAHKISATGLTQHEFLAIHLAITELGRIYTEMLVASSNYSQIKDWVTVSIAVYTARVLDAREDSRMISELIDLVERTFEKATCQELVEFAATKPSAAKLQRKLQEIPDTTLRVDHELRGLVEHIMRVCSSRKDKDTVNVIRCQQLLGVADVHTNGKVSSHSQTSTTSDSGRILSHPQKALLFSRVLPKGAAQQTIDCRAVMFRTQAKIPKTALPTDVATAAAEFN